MNMNMNMNLKSTASAPVLIACDHAGFELKNLLIQKNPSLSFDDLGLYREEKSSHYPGQARLLCRKLLSQTPSPYGVLVCGSGQGMAMAANRLQGIRAALVWNEESTLLARRHNNANVLCLPSRLLPFETHLKLFHIFLNTPFQGGRHLTRVKQLELQT